MLRRAEPKVVAIWIATTTKVQLDAVVWVAGSATPAGTTTTFHRVQVFDSLWVHLLLVTPSDGTFPTGKLLEYSVGVINADGDTEHDSFAAIVKADGLAYPKQRLPTFFLQASGAKLNVLYGSCRKCHDVKGGDKDALAYGDSFIFNNATDLSTRPAALCLGGDQIYADDVHDAVFDAAIGIAAKLEGTNAEQLPGSATPPGKGQRQTFMEKTASFTSGAAANHLVTLAEYVAMYGLAFNERNWPTATLPKEVAGFKQGLAAVRRLLANTPTYMIFDDHDVTDDWNLSIDWINQVKTSAVGSRVLVNALAAFWLFQAWGNDPVPETGFVAKFIDAVGARGTDPDRLAGLMHVRGTLNAWEFATPTVPTIYFLDTRTQRGYSDGFKRSKSGPPPYLKSPDSWLMTLKRLAPIIRNNGTKVPLVLVAPAPIFGYEWVDTLQRGISGFAGPYPFDLEGWAANQGHLFTFLLMCGNADVVVLSGDVHYGFSSTAMFSVFDSDFIRAMQGQFPGWSFPKVGSGTKPTFDHLYSSRFIQLCSSAQKNYASGLLAAVSRIPGAYGHIIDKDLKIREGAFKNPDLYRLLQPVPMLPGVMEKVDVADAKPNFVVQQRVNDASNTPYIDKHNLGLATFLGRRVDNAFLINGALAGKRSWDFASSTHWDYKP